MNAETIKGFVDANKIGPGLEHAIRAIVRDEINKNKGLNINELCQSLSSRISDKTS
jgi:hypothetical protein